jgi:hypothetical protein
MMFSACCEVCVCACMCVVVFCVFVLIMVSLSFPSLYRIYEMELRLNTPLKFRHPCYEALTWFAARNYLKEIKGI